MDDINLQLLDQLLSTFGPSGNEERIGQFIEKEIETYVDEVRKDALGNLIALKRGKDKKIMLAAHMDEIGLIITHIHKDGFLRFAKIGGVDVKIAVGQKVEFKDGTIGVISSEPIEDIKDLKIDRLFIDIGAKDREEALNKVSIGDVASFYGPLYIQNKRGISKAMDDRIGCYVLIEVLKNLKNNINDIYFVFTVQEEIGIRGAKTSAYGIHPDIGIAIDVTLTGDTPESKPMEVSLGKGPAIKIMDQSTICHPKVRKLLISTAKEHNIPYQIEVLDKGGTDAGAIHLTKSGVPSGVVSIPTRYIHTPGEMIDLQDVKSAIELITKLIEKGI